MVTIAIAHPVTRDGFIQTIMASTGLAYSTVSAHVHGYAACWVAEHPRFKGRATRKIESLASMSDKRLHGHSAR